MQRMQRMRWAIRCAAPIRGDEANPTFLTERSHGHNDPASGSDRVIAPETVRGTRSQTNPTHKFWCWAVSVSTPCKGATGQPRATALGTQAAPLARRNRRNRRIYPVLHMSFRARPAKNGAPRPIWRVRRRERQPGSVIVRSDRRASCNRVQPARSTPKWRFRPSKKRHSAPFSATLSSIFPVFFQRASPEWRFGRECDLEVRFKPLRRYRTLARSASEGPSQHDHSPATDCTLHDQSIRHNCLNHKIPRSRFGLGSERHATQWALLRTLDRSRRRATTTLKLHRPVAMIGGSDPSDPSDPSDSASGGLRPCTMTHPRRTLTHQPR
jgi:hypothetical protein